MLRGEQPASGWVLGGGGRAGRRLPVLSGTISEVGASSLSLWRCCVSLAPLAERAPRSGGRGCSYVAVGLVDDALRICQQRRVGAGDVVR